MRAIQSQIQGENEDGFGMAQERGDAQCISGPTDINSALSHALCLFLLSGPFAFRALYTLECMNCIGFQQAGTRPSSHS